MAACGYLGNRGKLSFNRLEIELFVQKKIKNKKADSIHVQQFLLHDHFCHAEVTQRVSV